MSKHHEREEQAGLDEEARREALLFLEALETWTGEDRDKLLKETPTGGKAD